VGVAPEDEISYEAIKKAMVEAKGQDGEILALFIGADNMCE